MSNGSDQLVQERPAWLIPAVVIIGVAIFSAVFAYYYFGPSPSEILGLDPRASESTEKVEMEIGGTQFLIPANFTRYPLQRVGGTQDEIDLHALLPELAPYSLDRREAFESNASDSGVVHIKVHVAEGLLPATRRLEDIYARHFSGNPPEEGPGGLTRYTFAAASGYRDQDLFTLDADSEAPFLLVCFHETDVIFSPNCTRTFRLNDNVAVTYRFKRHHLENWRNIDSAVTALVESFIVAELAP